MRLYIDIETEGREPETLTSVMPDKWPTGNTKDPVKLEALIEEKKQEWLEKAALSAMTGRIIAASYAVDDLPPQFIHDADEKAIIEAIVEQCVSTIDTGGRIYHFNGNGFDVPFIMQRAAKHGIPLWTKFRSEFRGRRSWHETFTDVMLEWNCAFGYVAGNSLKNVAWLLEVGEKSGDGADFAALLKSDVEAAKRYALNDVHLLRLIAKRMWGFQ